MLEVWKVPAVAAPRCESSVALFFSLGVDVQRVITHVITNSVQQLGQVSLGAGQRNLPTRKLSFYYQWEK